MKFYNISSNFEIIQALSNETWEVIDNATGRIHEVPSEWIQDRFDEIAACIAEADSVYDTEQPCTIDDDIDEVARADAEEFGDFSENEGRVNLAE